MVSKNVIAVLLVVLIVASLIGGSMLFVDFGNGNDVGKAQVKLNVIEKSPPPATGAVVKLNVIKRQG